MRRFPLIRRLKYAAALVVATLTLAQTARVAATGSFRRVAGTNLGAIPDSPGGSVPSYGIPRTVRFKVGGITSPVTTVRLTITMTHSFVGDLDVVLASPLGTKSMVVFSRTGAVTPSDYGDDSDLSGVYTFAEGGANWWTAAAGAGPTTAVPANMYSPSEPGPTASPAPDTAFGAVFGGLLPSDANGEWTLTIRDGAADDTGEVTAAALDVFPGTLPVLDTDGDGATDYAVVRSAGGAADPATWFVKNGAGMTMAQWGLGADTFLSGDYDGDGASDIAVWRAGIFYARQSSNGQLFARAWGMNGDDATVPGDYDGDGLTDPAVYRPGAQPSGQSVWYILRSSTATFQAIPWGGPNDRPMPGDYDGDGRTDVCIQRDESGVNRFYLLGSTVGVQIYTMGLTTDTFIPGDYDGDGTTDFAFARVVNGSWQVTIRKSSNGFGSVAVVGLAGDTLVPGDYDGDGRTDIAVWRPELTPGQAGFVVLRSTKSGSQIVFTPWGLPGDLPVARFQVR